MYFPYLRGRQYELIALRELICNNLLGDSIIPLVEPVKLSSTLIDTIEKYTKKNHLISIIRYPAVGSFIKDMQDAKEGTKQYDNKKKFCSLFDEKSVIKALIIKENSTNCLKYWVEKGVKKSDWLIIHNDHNFLSVYEQEFKSTSPQYVLIPDKSAFRRRIKRNRVLLDDRFEKQNRNADYQGVTDEFFSDDHLYYKDDGFKGFSDYSVVGNEYLESGFAPYAVVIHIVYFAEKEDNILKIKHFVSDSNEDITNPAKKFYEAVRKLDNWCRSENIDLTLGLKTFLEHYKRKTYPGLGSVKKLSIMHHLELMGKYLTKQGRSE